MELSLPYIAGLFDGEGSVAIYPAKNGTRSVHFRSHMVQNENPESTLIWNELRERFGGSIGTQLSMSGRPKLNWQVSQGLAAAFFIEIQPYTRLKRPQIDLALEWWAGREIPTRDSRGRVQARSDESWERAKDFAARIQLLKKPERA